MLLMMFPMQSEQWLWWFYIIIDWWTRPLEDCVGGFFTQCHHRRGSNTEHAGTGFADSHKITNWYKLFTSKILQHPCWFSSQKRTECQKAPFILMFFTKSGALVRWSPSQWCLVIISLFPSFVQVALGKQQIKEPKSGYFDSELKDTDFRSRVVEGKERPDEDFTVTMPGGKC